MKKIFVFLLLSLLRQQLFAFTITGSGATNSHCHTLKWVDTHGFHVPYVGLTTLLVSMVPTPPPETEYMLDDDECGNGGGGTVAGPFGPNGSINDPDTSPPTETSSGITTGGTQSVHNGGDSPITIGQSDPNGDFTGNIIVVPPGGTGQFPVEGTGAGWSGFIIPPGTPITWPPGSGFAPDPVDPGGAVGGPGYGGGIPIIGFPGDSFGSGETPLPIVPPYGGTPTPLPPIDAPPVYNSTVGDTNINYTTYPPATNNGAGPVLPPNYNGTNNPGGFAGGSGTNTVGASNAVDKATFTQGVNGIITGEANDSDDIVKAIQAADRANQQGHLAVSNAIGVGNNTLAGISNHIANIDTNSQSAASALTNLLYNGTNAPMVLSNVMLAAAMSAMNSATNGAAGLGFSTLASSASSAFNVGVGSGGGSGITGWTIGGSRTLTITPALATAVAPVGVVHDIVAWMAYASLFLACYRVFIAALRNLLVTPQTRTSGTELEGNTINFASALLMATVIVATVTVFGAHYVAELAGMLGSMSGNPFSALAALPGWGYVEICCPVDVVLGCVASYVTFKLGCDSAATVTAGIIKFYVGL